MRNHLTSQLVIAATLALVGCSDKTGPRGAAPAPVSLVVSTRQPVGPSATPVSASLQSGSPETFTDGTNTIVVSSVELVLREVELKRVEQADCQGGPVVVTNGVTEEAEADDASAEHEVDEPDEACEELQAGPVLVDLPLGAVERMFTAAVPAGTYDELKFQIHKLETDGDAADRDFLAAHPDLAGISIRVKGTFNGAAFTYTSDLNVEQKLRFDPPVQVTAGTPASVTVRLDLSGWFRDGSKLVDPGTATKGGVNQHLVRDNIKQSFKGFRDNDEDGLDDDHEEASGHH